MNVTFELIFNNLYSSETDITGNHFDTGDVVCAVAINGCAYSYLAPEALVLTQAELANRIRSHAERQWHGAAADRNLLREIADAVAHLPAGAIPSYHDMQEKQAAFDKEHIAALQAEADRIANPDARFDDNPFKGTSMDAAPPEQDSLKHAWMVVAVNAAAVAKGEIDEARKAHAHTKCRIAALSEMDGVPRDLTSLDMLDDFLGIAPKFNEDIPF